jgi:2-polyprenyl-3-methyl-5-hydroxy-6-metoxy-1,4-benzoquinol methylase
VIATGYSGNVDFMTPQNSFLVDYVTGAVPAGCAPYPVGSAWADPNLEQAAEFMRTVVRNPKEAARRAAQARRDILTRHTVEAAAETLKRRLDAIRGSRMRNRRRTDKVAGVDGATVGDSTQPLSSPLDRVTQLLTPTQSVQGGRFARARLMAQGVLFKVLRPYWWQQRQIQTLLIEAIRDASGQAGLRQSLEPLWQSVHALENASRSNGQAVERLTAEGRAIPPLQEHAIAMQEHVAALQEQAVASQEQVGVFQDHVSSFEESVSSFQAAASAHLKAVTEQLESVMGFQQAAGIHLKALTEQLEVVTQEATTLGNRLFAAPYMSDPDRFHYRDSEGKQVLGFRWRRPADGDEYVGFEDVFRGSEPFIRERLRAYLPLLRNCERVVEVGCGRGEFLDLLKENGIPAAGIDVDEAMVRRCLLKGHDAEVADVNQYLRAQPDSSVPAVFSAQVVEHLSYEDFLTFLRLSRAKLKPGGQLIFETVNPHAIEAFKTFFTDLTHQRPIFPEVALAWCWLEGFDRAYVLFPNGTGDLDHDRMTQGEYAVVASKDGGATGA